MQTRGGSARPSCFEDGAVDSSVQTYTRWLLSAVAFSLTPNAKTNQFARLVDCTCKRQCVGRRDEEWHLALLHDASAHALKCEHGGIACNAQSVVWASSHRSHLSCQRSMSWRSRHHAHGQPKLSSPCFTLSGHSSSGTAVLIVVRNALIEHPKRDLS